MQIYNIDICDKLGNNDKWLNLRNLIFKSYIEFDEFKNLIELEKTELNYNFIFYTGEILDEQESDLSIMINDDLRFAFKLLNKCIKSQKFCKFINASTTNIYEEANMPFSDDEKFINDFKPVDKFSYVKYLFERDIYMSNGFIDNKIVSLRYSNIFGANEYYKNEQGSLIYNIYLSIKKNKKINYNLNDKYDFLYIKDAVNMTLFFVKNEGINASGIYNVCSGKSTKLYDIYLMLINEMKKDIVIDDLIKDTEAKEYYIDNQKILRAGYHESIFDIQEALKDSLIYFNNNKYLGE